MQAFKPLKLRAEDTNDLPALSAVLQDSVCKIRDVSYTPKSRQLTLALNRYCWEINDESNRLRVRTGLQFGCVSSVQSQNLRYNAPDAVLNLLSMELSSNFKSGDTIMVVFSGGGVLQINIECIDIILADISAPWPASSTPDHKLDEHSRFSTKL